MNRKIIKRSVIPLLLVLILCYGYLEPHTVPGFFVYATAISVYSDKGAVLDFTHESLDLVQWGFLPPNLDSFLCYSFTNTNNESYKNAIIDFYVKRGPMRRGRCMIVIDDYYKEQIIDSIIVKLDMYSDLDAFKAFSFIESLRINGEYYKAGLFPNDMCLDDRESWWHYIGRPKATEGIKTWWAESNFWYIKEPKDPFEPVGLRWVEP